MAFKAVNLFCFLLFVTGCYSQVSISERHTYMRTLTVNDGLPQGQVRGMVQDKQGFIWIASEGLSRYDGRSFLNYKHMIGDTASIADNDIRDLQIDDQDNLWIIYASKTVDVLNARTGFIRHLSAEPAFQWMTTWTLRQVHFTVRQVGKQYFAVTGNRMLAFNPVTGKHEPAGHFEAEKLMALGSSGGTVLATTRGLYRLNGSRMHLFHHFPSFSDTVIKAWNGELDNRKSVGTILFGKDGKWIIPAVGGLYRYDPAADTSRYIGNPAKLRIPYTAILTKDGNTYFPNDTGIYRLKSNGPAELIHGNDGYPPLYALLLADRSGMLWASADVYGIRLFSLNPDNFRSAPAKRGFATDVLQPWLPLVPSNVNFSSYQMRSAKDTSGNIWLLNQAGLLQGGANINYTELYRFGSGAALRQPLRYTATARPYLIAFDGKNQCWLTLRDTVVSPKRMLAKLNLQTGAIQPWVRLQGGWKENGYLAAIARYVCYLPENELQLYDTATAACTIYSKEKLGVSGLLLMALPDRQQSNILWIATKGSGIIKLNVQTGNVQHYTEENGLPNSTVYYMAPDKKGFFWCSSNKGLFRFNPADGSVSAFTVKDGLQGNEFNRYHFLETPDGHFWFGGTEGHTVFHPDSVFLDSYQTPIAFTALQVNNIPLQKLAPGWKDTLVSNLSSITLPYYQNQLSFSFAGLQYNAPEKLQYRYQLQDIDKNWVVAGTDASARYASIPPGHYTFKVNATNTAGVWSSYVKTLEITILPPWWKTGWAYTIYILIIAGIGYALYRTWLQRVNNRQQLILKQKEAAQAQAMEETKSRFFANITHELRTPLTLIMSPVQKQLQEGETTYSPALLTNIYHHSQLLLRQINQLLDMSKLEAGSLPVYLSKGNIILFVQELVNGFKTGALAKKIDLQFDYDHLPAAYLFDCDKLEKIIYNLLGNALKFTPEGGSVHIILTRLENIDDKHLVQISVTDTGIGIATESLPYIFNRFYQVNNLTTRRYEGTGIGLSLVKELVGLMGGDIKVASTLGKSSAFTLTLPLSIADASSHFPDAIQPLIVESTVIVNQVVQPTLTGGAWPLVLVTEDNEQLRIFIKESLQTHYRVLTATNGEAGLQTTISELPDLIISDVMMPVMDGYEFCSKVKENPLTAHIGFVMLTAKRADESRVGGLRRGADHYLGKPFIVEELLLVVSNLLKRQQKLREFYSRQLQPGEKLLPVNEVEDEFLRSVYSIIETNLNNDGLDVAFLASAMAVSRRTLNRKLSAVANTSANEIIRSYRLKKAAGLLLKGQSVSEAAYITGFSTPSYFTQCFKEMYGTTPVQWIENGGMARN